VGQQSPKVSISDCTWAGSLPPIWRMEE